MEDSPRRRQVRGPASLVTGGDLGKGNYTGRPRHHVGLAPEDTRIVGDAERSAGKATGRYDSQERRPGIRAGG
jgi:hypothetical protein